MIETSPLPVVPSKPARARLWQKSWFSHLLIILSYGALALAFTWPLAAHFNQTIPGQETDTWQTFWHFQWTRDAFLHLQNPYFTTRLFYPEGTTLLYETMSPTNDLLGLPLQLLFGTFVTYNTLVLLTFALSGYSVWLLVRYLTGNQLAAYLAGFIFAFAPYRSAQLLNHLHLISTQWFVFYVYCLWRGLDFERAGRPATPGRLLRERGGWLTGASLFLILNIFNDWYYVFFLLIFTGVFLLWRLATQPGNRLYHLSGVTLTVGSGLLVGSPLIIAMLVRAASIPSLPFPKELSIGFSADLLSYFTPSTLNPWWGDSIISAAPNYMQGNPTEKVVFLGYVTLLLLLIASWKNWRQSGFWLATLLVFVVLSLGPQLHFNGLVQPGGPDSHLPLLFTLLNQTPLAGFVRIPSRFGMVAALAAAVLAGLGMAWLLEKLKRPAVNKRWSWGVTGAALLLVGLEFWTAPFRLANSYIPPVYNQIAQDSTTKAIAELPLQKNAWDFPRRMLFATVHGKSILQGYTSRPEANPLPPQNMPGLRQVLYNDLQGDITYANSQQAARAFFDFYGLGYVVVDTDSAGNKTVENTPKMLEQLFGASKVTRQDWAQDKITSYQITLGDSRQSLSRPLLVPGADWNTLEKDATGSYRWLGARGRLLALIPTGKDQPPLKLTLQGQSFTRPHTLALVDDNGHELTRLTVNPKTQTYESPVFTLPAGENWLNLVSLDGTDSPAALAPAGKPSPDQRQLSVAIYQLRLQNPK